MYQTARGQRNYFGGKAKKQQKKGRAQSISQKNACLLSSNGYFKILALHGIFLSRASGGQINPQKFLGEGKSRIVKRLKGND